ncbi:enoyl-CoA hydratase/isomerase family protein [Novosphingobium sp. M1R2S20]|uniref:Enoyl-CoA hydratase/isomerase family protein n=1 Tax=Novosphingobium rhizovicinum TaxID=3228928 RepID=A0ABV3R8C0_9SPHN
MNITALTVPATRLSVIEEPWRGPAAIVPLETAGHEMELRLPPCPVIGIGPSAHPRAAAFDLVVDQMSEIDTIVRNILAHPHAAATLVQVLRTTGGLEPVRALTVESMAYAMLQGSAEHAAWLARRKPRAVSAPGAVQAHRRDHVLEVTLDCAATGNAIDCAMRDGLFAALSMAALDRDIECIRLSGAGKAFSLGADLEEFGTTCDPATAHGIRSLTLPALAAIECADRLEARIDGACVGAGLELAAFSHRIVASRRSWFQLPELSMGIIPGAGGCVSLPRRIGRQRTALMVLSGRRISARVAHDWGLIDTVVNDFTCDQSGDHMI